MTITPNGHHCRWPFLAVRRTAPTSREGVARARACESIAGLRRRIGVARFASCLAIPAMSELADALTFFAVFLFSTTLHEAAHAWAALKGGDPTAYHGGQVSLDPLPHIRREPLGMLVLPLLTALTTGWPMGFASAPYDPE